MCNDGTQDVLVGISDVQQELKDTINTMVGVDRMFTAWDVTVLARQNTGKVLGRHNNVLKHMIHDLLNPLPDSYEKTLVTLTSGEQAFLYHPDDKLPSEYHLCDDFNDVVDSVDNSLPQKTTSRQTSKISVPKGLLTDIGVTVGDTVYLSPISDGVEILTYAPIQNMSTVNINGEGRLRLAVSCLKAYGLVGDEFDISLGQNGKSILIKNIKDA